MAKLDDLIEELREQGREEDAEELEKLSGSTLRKKAGNADRLEKELADTKAKLDALEKGPKVRKAFEKAGVDFESLSRLERKALEGYDGDLDEEAVEAFIEENELSVTDESAEGDEEKDAEPAAAKVAKAARRSDSSKGGSAIPKIAPGDVKEWAMDKRVAFADANPEAWEALKSGQTVTGVKAPI